LFTEAGPRWELRGWELRRWRLKIGKTQTEFAKQAGWSQQYQAKIENSSICTLTSDVTRWTIREVFDRFRREDVKFWNTCMNSFFCEPNGIVDKIFSESKRYWVNSKHLLEQLPSRVKRKNFALLTGWSPDYVRQLIRGDTEIVSEQAATKIVCALINLQDPSQV